MTVSTTVFFTDWSAANGVNKDWSYDFNIGDEAEVQVLVRDGTDDTTIQVFVDNFQLTKIGDGDEGFVTYPVTDSALAAGKQVRIRRIVSLLQTTEIGNEGDFRPQLHERTFDKLVKMIQQVSGGINGSLKRLGDGEGYTVLDLTPDRAIVYQNGYIQSGPLVTEIGNAQGYSETAKRWATAAEGVDVDDGVNPVGKSSYHWAQIALGAAAGALPDNSVGTSVLQDGAVTRAKTDGSLGLAEFENLGSAEAASVPSGVSSIRTRACVSAGDRGGADWMRAVSEPAHNGKFQSADGAWWEYASDVVNVRAFGAKGVDLANDDDTNAITKAWNCAKALGRALYLPTGTYIVKGKIVLDAQFSIFGDGYDTVIYSYDLNDTIFEIAPAGTNMDYSEAHSFRAIAHYSSSAVSYDNSALFKMSATSTASDYFQWSNFANILAQGFRQVFWANGSARSTAYGFENNWSWNTFNNIRFLPAARPCLIGFRMSSGSGTGNEYYDIKGFVGGSVNGVDTAGAVFEFGANVVGDVVISGGHFGSLSVLPSFLISAGPSTGYRSRISISNVQLDAGMQRYFTWATGAVAPSNIKFIGCNVGGGADVGGLPPVWLSQIHGVNVSDQRLGRVVTVAAAGAANEPYFKVTLAPNSGTVIDVIMSGVVQGVGSSVVFRRVFIRSGASTITEIVDISGGSSPATGAVIGLGSTSSGLVVTFSVQFTSTAANTSIEAQAILVGGTAFLSEA